MKMNFWQWIGILLVLLGGAFWIYQRSLKTTTAPTRAPAPTTQR